MGRVDDRKMEGTKRRGQADARKTISVLLPGGLLAQGGHDVICSGSPLGPQRWSCVQHSLAKTQPNLFVRTFMTRPKPSLSDARKAFYVFFSLLLWFISSGHSWLVPSHPLLIRMMFCC